MTLFTHSLDDWHRIPNLLFRIMLIMCLWCYGAVNSIQYNVLGEKGSATYSGPTATMTDDEAKRALAAVHMATILIDERVTLGQLKKELSTRLNGLPVNEFRILKNAGV
jgi:hypothetical protein